MIANFKDFINNVIVESLHPELQQIITSPTTNKAKQNLLANKIKNLTSRGESTGIEGNMPKGSSRAYIPHKDLHPMTLDGKHTEIKTGTKVAIKAQLDKYHKKADHDGLSLGAMQNRAENNDHWVNKNYRILSHEGGNNYKTNKESGIFPPLIDHDEKNHEHSHVGHSRDIKAGEFQKLTKTDDHPKGISPKDFHDTLMRFHNRNNGKHWVGSFAREKEMDHIETHPLVQKFIDYHGNTGNSPADYQQKKNLGVFEHPDGSHHIVARDHGFDNEVAGAYTQSRRNAMKEGH